MNDYFARFSESPASFKKSFAALTLAWVCHPIYLYSLFWAKGAVDASNADIKKMAVISLSLIVLLFSIKKWARALVVVGSSFILINDFFFLYVTPHNKISTLLCVVVVLFSIVGSYWLFAKDTRDYFTKLNPKIDPPDSPEPNTGPNHPR